MYWLKKMHWNILFREHINYKNYSNRKLAHYCITFLGSETDRIDQPTHLNSTVNNFIDCDSRNEIIDRLSPPAVVLQTLTDSRATRDYSKLTLLNNCTTKTKWVLFSERACINAAFCRVNNMSDNVYFYLPMKASQKNRVLSPGSAFWSCGW